MTTSITGTGLLLLSTILALAVTCWVARRPRRTAVGIVLGTLVGVGLTLALSFAVGFLGWVLPLGQMDYWLASLVAG